MARNHLTVMARNHLTVMARNAHSVPALVAAGRSVRAPHTTVTPGAPPSTANSP